MSSEENQMANTLSGLLLECFDVIDADNSGAISLDEFRTFIDAQAKPCTEAELRSLFVEVDRDESGEIDQEEFVELVELLEAKLRITVQDMANAFETKCYETLFFLVGEGARALTPKELRGMVDSVNDTLRLGHSNEDIRKLFSDYENCGRIEMIEFEEVMRTIKKRSTISTLLYAFKKWKQEAKERMGRMRKFLTDTADADDPHTPSGRAASGGRDCGECARLQKVIASLRAELAAKESEGDGDAKVMRDKMATLRSKVTELEDALRREQKLPKKPTAKQSSAEVNSLKAEIEELKRENAAKDASLAEAKARQDIALIELESFIEVERHSGADGSGNALEVLERRIEVEAKRIDKLEGTVGGGTERQLLYARTRHAQLKELYEAELMRAAEPEEALSQLQTRLDREMARSAELRALLNEARDNARGNPDPARAQALEQQLQNTGTHIERLVGALDAEAESSAARLEALEATLLKEQNYIRGLERSLQAAQVTGDARRVSIAKEVLAAGAATVAQIQSRLGAAKYVASAAETRSLEGQIAKEASRTVLLERAAQQAERQGDGAQAAALQRQLRESALHSAALHEALRRVEKALNAATTHRLQDKLQRQHAPLLNALKGHYDAQYLQVPGSPQHRIGAASTSPPMSLSFAIPGAVPVSPGSEALREQFHAAKGALEIRTAAVRALGEQVAREGPEGRAFLKQLLANVHNAAWGRLGCDVDAALIRRGITLDVPVFGTQVHSASPTPVPSLGHSLDPMTPTAFPSSASSAGPPTPSTKTTNPFVSSPPVDARWKPVQPPASPRGRSKTRQASVSPKPTPVHDASVTSPVPLSPASSRTRQLTDFSVRRVASVDLGAPSEAARARARNVSFAGETHAGTSVSSLGSLMPMAADVQSCLADLNAKPPATKPTVSHTKPETSLASLWPLQPGDVDRSIPPHLNAKPPATKPTVSHTKPETSLASLWPLQPGDVDRSIPPQFSNANMSLAEGNGAQPEASLASLAPLKQGGPHESLMGAALPQAAVAEQKPAAVQTSTRQDAAVETGASLADLRAVPTTTAAPITAAAPGPGSDSTRDEVYQHLATAHYHLASRTALAAEQERALSLARRTLAAVLARTDSPSPAPSRERSPQPSPAPRGFSPSPESSVLPTVSEMVRQWPLSDAPVFDPPLRWGSRSTSPAPIPTRTYHPSSSVLYPNSVSHAGRMSAGQPRSRSAEPYRTLVAAPGSGGRGASPIPADAPARVRDAIAAAVHGDALRPSFAPQRSRTPDSRVMPPAYRPSPGR